MHGILLDLSPATDDYHFVDWDTIRGDEAGVIGELSVAAQYETFVAQTATGIGHIVRIGHDDAGQVLLADDLGTGINIDFLRIERILVPVNTIGTSGGPVTTLTPTDSAGTLTVDDVDKIINIDGHLYKIVTDHHSGHGKSVTFTVLADDNFLDFHYRPSEVVSPSNGNFAFFTGDYTFQRYTNTGTIGWRNYDPFATGEPWAAYTYLGWEANRNSSTHDTTALNQAYAIVNSQEVVYVSSFTAATDGYEIYKPVLHHNFPYFHNPVCYWYMHGQTVRTPSAPLPYAPTQSGGFSRYRFNSAAPVESFFGGEDVIGDIFTGVATTDIDVRGTLVSDTSLVVFSPPPGLYTVDLTVAMAVADVSVFVGLLRIESGTDSHCRQNECVVWSKQSRPVHSQTYLLSFTCWIMNLKWLQGTGFISW